MLLLLRLLYTRVKQLLVSVFSVVLIIEIIGLLLSLVLVLFLNVLILIKLFSIHHFYGLLLL